MLNKVVLDQSTASQGSVCVIIGSSYCIYIPEHDADGGIIHQAEMQWWKIVQLTELIFLDVF